MSTAEVTEEFWSSTDRTSNPPKGILNLPFQSAEDNRGRDPFALSGAIMASTIITTPHGQGDERGEPDQHGKGIQGEDGNLIGETLQKYGCESEIGYEH